MERQVRRGDLTVKVARATTEAAAAQLRHDLRSRADGFQATPRVFLDRLVEAAEARKRSREQMSLEGLQRETNRLLRLSLVEQQLQTRAQEFEGKTYVRRMPGGQPAPTLDSLLAFHQTASLGGDEAAVEWTRRQLEIQRPRVADAEDQRRIDLACDRPDSVNPRLVAAYLEAISAGDPAEVERFASNAVESSDANACVAAFLLARAEPSATAVRWVRDLLNSLSAFPAAALETLRAVEAETRGEDVEAARAQADYAIALAEAQARLTGVTTPTAEEIARAERVRAKPVAKLGQPIGLALDRRGYLADEAPATTADSEFEAESNFDSAATE